MKWRCHFETTKYTKYTKKFFWGGASAFAPMALRRDKVALAGDRQKNRRHTRADTDKHGPTRTGRGWPPRTRVVGKGLQTIVCPRKKTLSGTTRASMPAHGCCEAVAAERAGGERGIHFAGQNECRVPPSNKAASEAPAATLRRVLNAGRRDSKECLQTRLHRCASGKKGPGKSEGLSPGWGRAAHPGCGAGRGVPRRKALHLTHTDTKSRAEKACGV